MAVVVPIAADYDNSGVKSAQQAFAQFGSALSKTLQQASRDARRAFGDLEDGAKDSSTAAQRLAQAITGAADKLDTELTKSRTAAEALAKALGPELVARSGGINKVVRDLQKAGLTLDDIANEADTLAAALKKVDDVQLKNVTAQADKLDTAIKGVGDQTDRSKSVMANFAGNAAQEIPGVASAMGPLNVAIGQFAEYAAEGDIKLRGLATAIGPIAAIGAALALVSGYFNSIAKTKAFNKENLDAYTQAIVEGSTAAQALEQRLREVGKATLSITDPNAFAGFGGIARQIEIATTGVPGLGLLNKAIGFLRRDKIEDVTDELGRLGLNVKTASELASQGRPAIDKWSKTLLAGGASAKDVALATSFLILSTEQLEQAQRNGAITQQFLNGTVFDYSGLANIQVAVQEELNRQTENARRAQDGYARSIDGVREAFYKRNNASYAAQDAELNAKDAINAANKAQEKANKSRNPKDIAAAAEATRDAQRAINDAAAATDAYTEATSSSTDATAVARDRTAAVVRQLKELEVTIKAGSPLWDSIQAYKFLLETIPTEVNTKFGISFGNVRTPAPGRLELPQLSSGAITGNAGGVTNNITINGAVDPVATATQIDKIQTRQNQRYGTDN